MSGVATAVYLDAATAEPLALVRGISVCEPSWSPLFLFAVNKRSMTVWLQTFGPFALLGLYVALVLLVVGMALGIRWLRTRRNRAVQ